MCFMLFLDNKKNKKNKNKKKNSLRPSDIDWVNIGSGNGLLPNDTKPLPEPMLSHH